MGKWMDMEIHGGTRVIQAFLFGRLDQAGVSAAAACRLLRCDDDRYANLYEGRFVLCIDEVMVISEFLGISWTELEELAWKAVFCP